MPRALFVIHGPTFGGAHMQALRLREPLAARGWDSLILLPAEPGNAVERLRDGGAEVVTMELHRLRATLSPSTHARFLLGIRPEVRAIRSLIRERGVDVVQVHGPTNPHGALAARKERVAVVWQLLDLTAPVMLRRLAMPLVVRVADAATALGRAVADQHPGAHRLGPRLVQVTPVVDASAFDPDRRDAARVELGVQPDQMAIGTVGIRTPEKDHLTLTRAVAGIAGDHPGAVLRLLGAPSPVHAEYEEVVRAAAGSGGLENAFAYIDPGRRVAELLPGLDVFVLPSRAEGMPAAILEAMSCGLPVIGTRVGSVPELIQEGVTGLLVPPEDPVSMGTAIGRLLEDPGLRRAMGSAGRRRALELCDLDSVADAHVKAFEIALEHRTARDAGR